MAVIRGRTRECMGVVAYTPVRFIITLSFICVFSLSHHSNTTSLLQSQHFLTTLTATPFYLSPQVIKPGESFIYGSGTVLNTPTGSIEGGFHVIESDDMGIDFETKPLKERYDFFQAMIEDENFLGENFKAALPITQCRADVPCHGSGQSGSSGGSGVSSSSAD